MVELTRKPVVGVRSHANKPARRKPDISCQEFSKLKKMCYVWASALNGIRGGM
jgi:hypothetical protein